jgi:hypothetical protein
MTRLSGNTVLLASLIQYYNKMISDNFNTTNCPTINHLVKGVMAVLKVSASEASTKLKEWSTEVQENFTASNAMAIGCVGSTEDVKECLKTQGVLLTELLKNQNKMQQQQLEMTQLINGLQNNITDLEIPSPAKSPAKRSRVELEANDIKLSSSSSSSSWSSTKKLKGSGTKRNEKNLTIKQLLEAAARAEAVDGQNETFCFTFALAQADPSKKNESAKIKVSLNFVYSHVTSDEMKLLKAGDPKNDTVKRELLSKTCTGIHDKVEAALLKLKGKVKSGPRETYTVISVYDKLKQPAEKGGGVEALFREPLEKEKEEGGEEEEEEVMVE